MESIKSIINALKSQKRIEMNKQVVKEIEKRIKEAEVKTKKVADAIRKQNPNLKMTTPPYKIDAQIQKWLDSLNKRIGQTKLRY